MTVKRPRQDGSGKGQGQTNGHRQNENKTPCQSARNTGQGLNRE